MIPDLEKLIQLQAAENRMREVDLALQEIPQQRTALDAELAQEREKLATAREKLATAQKRRRQNETTLQDFETRRSKYKGQLMEVKTNKEYQAMLHEIDSVEREVHGIEDRILDDMEAAEALAGEIAAEEKLFKQAGERHAAATRALDDRAARLERERAQFVATRDAVAAELPEDLLGLFRRVARLRGVAVAEARDARCQQCNVLLRPQMFVDLKRNDQVQQCPSCNCILYFAGPAPAPVAALP
jgi:predicted  nucleic acid-binding Zn-ribbon protein